MRPTTAERTVARTPPPRPEITFPEPKHIARYLAKLGEPTELAGPSKAAVHPTERAPSSTSRLRTMP